MKATDIGAMVEPVEFLVQAAKIGTVKEMAALLSQLPIVGDDDYQYNPKDPSVGWTEGKLHWMPVGGDRWNAGRIKHGARPENPIAERVTNGMEALIELERRRELAKNKTAAMPMSPREAITRYFGLPRLDQLPKLSLTPEGKKLRDKARDIAHRVRVRVSFDKASREFLVCVEDDGLGQQPNRMHETVLSLGGGDKGDKPYLVGVFGQGGSSTYAVSEYSWCMSRRAPGIDDVPSAGVGWTVVKHIYPKHRRDDYFAYLCAHPDGRVPEFPATAADAIGLKHGTRFQHLKYNFGTGGAAIIRGLYVVLNHIVYDPVLPYELFAGPTQALMFGNGYRLSTATVKQKTKLDKLYGNQKVDVLSPAAGGGS